MSDPLSEHRDGLVRFAALFAKIGHPVRLLVLLAASDGEVSPVRFAGANGDASLGVASYHFRELADLGLIEERRTIQRRGATEHIYVITEKGRRMLDALQAAEEAARS